MTIASTRRRRAMTCSSTAAPWAQVFAIGESPAGLRSHLTAANRLQSVDLVQVEPLSGEGSAQRIVFDPLH